MRKLGYVIAGIVLLLVIALLAAPAFLDVNRYRPRIQAELEQHLDRPVALGTIHLRLLPPSFRVENVVIAEDPALHTGRPFAQVPNLYVKPRLLPLLSGTVELSALELERPQVELIRTAQGNWNFATIGKTSAKPPGASASPAVVLDHLQLTDGQMALTDMQKRQPRAVYDHIDLDLRNFAADKQFDITLAAHLPGAGVQKIELNGSAGPVKQNNMAATPFQGSLKLDQVAIVALQKFLNSDALKGIDATLSGIINAHNQDGVLAGDGNLKIENARLRGAFIDYPITLTFKASDDLNQELLRIAEGALKLGATPISLTGTISTKSDPAQLDVHVKASNASISEMARLAGAMGVAFNPGTKVEGSINADLTARGAASAPAMNGSIKAQDIRISGANLARPVDAKDIELDLTPDAIHSNQFTLSTANTALNARFDLQKYTTSSPVIDLGLATSNAQLGEVLQIAQAYGIAAAEGMSGAGVLNLNLHAAGPIKKTDAMTFTGDGSLSNASLKTPTLTEPLNIKSAALRFTQNSMVLQDLAASLGRMNASGQLSMRNFESPIVQFGLNADRLNINELQKIVVSQPPKPGQKSGSSLNNVTGTGTINVGSIQYNDIIMENANATANFDHGVVKLAPITATAFGGQETGSIIADTRTTPMTIQVATNLQKADANKVLSSVSNLKQTLYGMLAANGQTKFALGASEADIARSLNGNLSLNLENGKILNMDLLHELANVGRFLGQTAPKQNFTNLLKMSGDFNVQNGIANTSNLKAAIEGGTLAANGMANLVDNTLNLHVTAVLSKDYSAKVGGTNIGGFMQTALANNQGELVVPVIITGTFASPRFAPDVQAIAQMKLQNLLPTSGNPGQLTSGILGAVLGGRNANGQNPAGGIQGILGAIAGQKQQQQQAQPPQQQTPPAQNQNPPTPDQQANPPKQQTPQNAVNDVLQKLMERANKKQQEQKQPPPPQPPPPQNPPPKS